MWHRVVSLLLVILSIIFLSGGDQNYAIIHERAELVSYNASLVTKDVIFSFRKVNRTAFSFNTSFTLLQDVTDEKVMVFLGADKLYGSEYKRTGTSISANVCKFWKKNTFGMREDLSKYGNLEACNVVKKKYYLYNYIPNVSMFPKFIPFGSYRLILDFYHQEGSKFFLMHWYARVEKVTKW